MLTRCDLESSGDDVWLQVLGGRLGIGREVGCWEGGWVLGVAGVGVGKVEDLCLQHFLCVGATNGE
jgi:hypothetical protein